MTNEGNKGFDLRWTPEHDSPRAVIFEPAETDWSRTEFEWTGEEWREVGCERVTDVACFGKKDEYVAPDGPRPRPVDDEDRRGENDA